VIRRPCPFHDAPPAVPPPAVAIARARFASPAGARASNPSSRPARVRVGMRAVRKVPHVLTMVLARPPRDAMTTPERLALEACKRLQRAMRRPRRADVPLFRDALPGAILFTRPEIFTVRTRHSV